MICKCGHAKNEHEFENRIFSHFCVSCYKSITKPVHYTVYTPWHYYKADNLKYLEKKYEESIK